MGCIWFGVCWRSVSVWLWWGTTVAQWLRCCTTNRKVAGSIPAGVIGIFHWHNPSDRTMALGSTQPLTEISTRSISWGKCGRCVRLTTLPPSCAVVMESGNLNFLEPSGPLQAYNGTDLFLFTCFEHSCAHHQEVKIVLYSIWYPHTCRWPSGAQSYLNLCTGRPPTGVMITDAV